jgi:hypothetical protein
MSKPRLLPAILLVAAAASLAAAWIVAERLRLWPASFFSSQVDRSVRAVGIPVVMRTPGGLLEVATVTADEHFTRRDVMRVWGVSLGETVSEVRVPVTYRFHIELAREWVVTLDGTRAIVSAPELEPSLPVAFDTGAMRRTTKNGWARFNKDENLAAAERAITTELEGRAGSPRYLALVREDARRTIVEFVSRWLLTEPRWKSAPGHAVVVLFPGERVPGPSDPAAVAQ